MLMKDVTVLFIQSIKFSAQRRNYSEDCEVKKFKRILEKKLWQIMLIKLQQKQA